LNYRQSGTGYAVGLPAAGKHLYYNAKKQIMLNLISLGLLLPEAHTFSVFFFQNFNN